jgi:hypothetical protein
LIPLLLPFVPIVVWLITDESWHPYLAALYAVCFTIAVMLYARRVRRQLAPLRGFGPADYAGAWLSSWSETDYMGQIKALLERRGWRVISAEVAGRNRVLTQLHKDRFYATVLLVRPGVAVTDADVAMLAERRRASGAQRACLVSADAKDLPSSWAQAETQTAYLRYADLAELNDVVGFGD